MTLEEYIAKEKQQDPKFKKLYEENLFRIEFIKMVLKEKLKNNISEEEIARKSNLSLSTILRFEAGEIEGQDCLEIGMVMLQAMCYQPKPKAKYFQQQNQVAYY